MTREPAILVVTGPTAVGKTQAALELGRQLDAELIGADSVQVYRGFDIGSGKPRADELGDIAHHLIDVRQPTQPLDAAEYAALADHAIADVHRRGKLPIVVGGTGLWLRALLRGLVSVPSVDPVLRARLEQEWDAAGAAAMHERLQRVDPISAEHIHANDKLRVVRALEVYEQTGQPLGAARQAHALGLPRYRALVYVLDLAPERHRQYVAARVRAMIEAGFAAEVSELLERYGSEVRALGSVGYKQMALHVTAGVGLTETEAAIVRATLIYARRQRTWWSTDPSVRRKLAPETLDEPSIRAEIAEFLMTSRPR
jgi:tRNA dimethylallyltransferase